MNGTNREPELDRELQRALQASFAIEGHEQLQRDLWPQALRRMDEDAVKVSRFDWVLAALLLLGLILFPQGIPALLYHI